MQFGNSTQGKVFYFPGQDNVDQDKRAWVRVRAPTDDFVRKTYRDLAQHKVELRAVEIKGKVQPGQVEYDDVDTDKMYDAFWDFCIVEWGNIEVDNKPLECSKENKIMLMGGDDMFSSCVKVWREELEKSNAALAEVKSKN